MHEPTKNPADELEQILDQAADQVIPEPPAEDAPEEEKQRIAGFRVENEEQLAWATRKYAMAEQQAVQVRQAAKAQIDKVTTWRDRALTEQNGRMEFFRRLCEDYLRRRQVDDKKLKGIPTAYGRVQSRAQQPEWMVLDQDDLVACLKATGRSDLVRVKEEPALADLKKDSNIELRQVGIDPLTNLPVYQLWIRQVDKESGELLTEGWLPGVLVKDQPVKVTVEVGK